MESKETFVFNRIDVEGNPSIGQLIFWFQKKMYDDYRGIGFTSIINEDGIIVSQILFRSPSYIQHYDADNGLFEKQVINVYCELELFYDIDKQMIYTTSSQVKFSKAKALLRECIEGKVTFRNIEFSAKKMYEKMMSMNFNPIVTDLSIKQFRYKEGAIGKYSVHINDNYLGIELLNEYPESIHRMTLSVQSNKYPDFVLSFTSQNSFTLKCKERDIWAILNDIKTNM